MKVLIVGLGSIAQKHLQAIRTLEPGVEIYSLRSGKSSHSEAGVENILDIRDLPQDLTFILICNPTSEHYATIKNLIHLGIPFFLEKPPFKTIKEAEEISELMVQKDLRTYTAFNFRFHPALLWLRDHVSNYRVLEVRSYCGSYLPNWRTGIDYRTNYSAKSELGGGVHLDLIHELDFLLWIFGKPNRSHLFLNKVSDLEIDSIDSATYFLEYSSKIISIQLNYFRRDPKRSLEIVTDAGTLYVDLLKNQVTDDQQRLLFHSLTPISDTYRAQMEYFLTTLQAGERFINDVLESTTTMQYALQNS